ncbi:hypothetical protein [Halomicronema sp. CCY15110]|uniref:hypothetical protein n=1 Tax=Halomicronema sp. CCY15110 TaxID=2767773 RepID=UPI00194F0BA9|nr:hypothetical protein [Halomicronema sp. CCY15110]
MNRYVLAALLGAIAFLTLLGISNSQDMLRGSRNSLSATPSSAAEGDNLSGIESAGQNVLRQTSPEAIERLPNLADGTPAQPALNPGATEPTSPTDPNATPPVPPSTTPPTPAPETPPPTDQEAIPALW